MNIRLQSRKLELVLKKHQLLSLNEAQPKMAIECKEGLIWVTHAGDLRDYMLEPGHHFTPRGKGSLVIEALDDARVDIEEP